MKNKQALIVGRWDYPWNFGSETGLRFFENGDSTEDMIQKANIGTQVYDEKNNIIYICEEVMTDYVLGKGYGGQIIALRLTDGKILSRVRTYGNNPTHSAFDPDRKYLIVAHHNEPSVDSTEAKTGCPINLYELNQDGSIGVLKDRIIVNGEKKAELHSIYCAPSGNFFVVNNCGADELFTLKIVEEKLVITDRIQVEERYCPRYGAFHPTLPLYYGNNEKMPKLSTYSYDEEGKLTKIRDLSMMVGDEKSIGNAVVPASDLTMHPNAKYIYVALRRVDRIVAIAIDETGDTKVIQSIDCGGEGTRGLRIDKSGTKMYVCNHASGDVSIFNILLDGKLENSGEKLDVIRAANITIAEGISVEDWPKGPMIPGVPVSKK